MPKGKPYSVEFKARLALESLQGAKTVGEIATWHGLNPNLVRNWKAKAESDLSRVFSAAEGERARERELTEHREEVGDLHRKIGELTAERDYLRRGLHKRYGIDIEDVPGRPWKRRGPGREAVPAAGDPQVELLLQAEEAPARGGPHEEDERAAGAHEAQPAQAGQVGINHVLKSMDGKARRADNVIVERWSRSLKSECVRVDEYGAPAELRRLSRVTSSSATTPARTSRSATTRRPSGTIRG